MDCQSEIPCSASTHTHTRTLIMGYCAISICYSVNNTQSTSRALEWIGNGSRGVRAEWFGRRSGSVRCNSYQTRFWVHVDMDINQFEKKMNKTKLNFRLFACARPRRQIKLPAGMFGFWVGIRCVSCLARVIHQCRIDWYAFENFIYVY